MNKQLVNILVIVMLTSTGCSSLALKHTGYNPDRLMTIAVVEPVVSIEKIQGRSIDPLVIESQTASLFLEKSIQEQLGQIFHLEEEEDLSDPARDAIYAIFAKIDTLLDRGGLYDSEARVNASHRDVNLDQLKLAPALLRPLPHDQSLLLLTLLNGMSRDGQTSQKVVTAEDAIAGVSDALEVDNAIITHYSYLAVALVDVSQGTVLYFNKHYRHQDPRDQKNLLSQLQTVLEPMKTAGPEPTSNP